MTLKQIRRYRREWAEIREILTTLGEFSDEDAEAQRHEITLATLGFHKSSAAFTNDEFDHILDAFEAYRVIIKGPSDGPSRAETQPRKRLLYAIDQLGLDAPYLADIAHDQFKTPEKDLAAWRDQLTLDQLKLFRWTATARAASLRRRKARLATPAKSDPS